MTGKAPLAQVEDCSITTVSSPLELDSSLRSQVFCRICHDTSTETNPEPLISPCKCSGSVAVVHKSCLERWLSTSSKSGDKYCCELCGHQFKTVSKPMKASKWLWGGSACSNDRRNLITSCICFLLLTPLTFVSYFLMMSGLELRESEPGVAAAVIFMSVSLIACYMVWLSLAIRYHVSAWLEWRANHRDVKLTKITMSPFKVHHAAV